MKYLFLSLLFSTSLMANQVDCEELYGQAESDCNGNVVECRSLGACISKRKTCPMDIGSPSACASFDECMKDTDSLISKKPKDLGRRYFKNRCIYTWNAGKCYLYNTGMEIFTFPHCPGRRIFGKGNDDSNFDCEGHRKQAKKDNLVCNASYDVYVKLCKKKEGYKFKEVPKGRDCKYLSAKLFPADTEHKGALSVDDGSRDRYKAAPQGDDGASSGGQDGAGK